MAMRGGKLKGKRVVLTGVSRGVGFEIAKKFLAEGARVLGVARNRANLKKADRFLSRYGKNYSSVLADVATPAAARKIAKAAARRLKAVDLLINNAGANLGGRSFETEGEKGLERTLQVNVLGIHRITLALLPLLRRGKNPRVVNVSSGAGNFHSVSHSDSMDSYRMSKWSLNGLTMIYASQFKGRISFIAMDPGWVRTDMGGPKAPDHVSLSSRRALEIALLPKSVTGTYQIGSKKGGW